jgi:hypothetical protein
MFSMPWQVSPDAEGVLVRVDSGDLIEEIYEGNNQGQALLADIREEPRRKRRIYLDDQYQYEQMPPVATYKAPYVQNIKLDGLINEADWQKAKRRGPLKTKDDMPSEKPTYVRIAYGPKALYFAFEACEPDMNLLVETARERDSHPLTAADDALLLFIDANGDKKTFHEFVANTEGVQGEGWNANMSLYNEPWECKIHKGPDFWTAEVEIPYESIKAQARPGQTWGINVCRNARTFRPPDSVEEREKGWKWREFLTLSPTFAGYHRPHRFAAVTFADK